MYIKLTYKEKKLDPFLPINKGTYIYICCTYLQMIKKTFTADKLRAN